eukprot:TRINITY_DN5327_c0_g1_i2.p2 TRINITY_DN5327_c0_g1~~TRINITY_DN5327_c0_g1_i2.p2  ORF type:complete len:108 (-),score=22.34 TRINITY_DN5327_c0_g1_i2:131-454(-)
MITKGFFSFFFFSSRRRHTRCREVSWARRCVQETALYMHSLQLYLPFFALYLFKQKIHLNSFIDLMSFLNWSSCPLQQWSREGTFFGFLGILGAVIPLSCFKTSFRI